MRYLYKQFQAKKKEIVEVELDRSTKVKFMTALEYRRYERGRTHTFYGGTFDGGTVHFVLPFDSVWTVVVERGSHSAPIPVNARCRLLPPDREVRSTRPEEAPALTEAGPAVGGAGEEVEVDG